MLGERYGLLLEASDLGFVFVGLTVVASDLGFHASHLCFLAIDDDPTLVLRDFLFEVVALGLGFVVMLTRRFELFEQLFLSSRFATDLCGPGWLACESR